MPPVKLPESITSLSDQELANKLIEHGVRLGPILPTTRGVYERKLFHLQTGKKVASPLKYEPVDDDEEEDMEASGDDDEVTFQQKQAQHLPRQRTTQTSRTQPRDHTPPRQQIPDRAPYQQIPDRMPYAKPSPRRPLHATANTNQNSSSERGDSPTAVKSQGGIPLWVKFVAIAVIAVVVFLVIKNMEPDPASQVPEITIDV